MTFMMRPSVPSPTGTMMGWPVSVTDWPRVRPSEMSMAMQRTEFSPRCWATSRTRRLPLFEVSSAFRISGRWPSNFTSTTGPMTWVIWPGVRFVVALRLPPLFWVKSSMMSSRGARGARRLRRLRYERDGAGGALYSASAPEMISISSLVIIAWRERL